MGEVPKKNKVSFNVFILFLLVFTHDYLAMQALIWLCMDWFRAIQYGMIPFGPSYMNLRQPHTFKHQI